LYNLAARTADHGVHSLLAARLCQMNWQPAVFSRKGVKLLFINYSRADEKVRVGATPALSPRPTSWQRRRSADTPINSAKYKRIIMQRGGGRYSATCAKLGKPSCNVKIEWKTKMASNRTATSNSLQGQARLPLLFTTYTWDDGDSFCRRLLGQARYTRGDCDAISFTIVIGGRVAVV